MRIVVYGGRNFADRDRLYRHLDKMLDESRLHSDPLVIIQGLARGADALARNWAISRQVSFDDFPATWDDLDAKPCKVKFQPVSGKPYNALAGFNRNQQMVDIGKPDFAVECPGGAGTKDMRQRLVAARIPIFLLR